MGNQYVAWKTGKKLIVKHCDTGSYSGVLSWYIDRENQMTHAIILMDENLTSREVFQVRKMVGFLIVHNLSSVAEKSVEEPRS
jgi:hypothetical protein